MKKLLLIIIVLIISSISLKSSVQILQFGIKAQTDIQNSDFVFHNISVGGELDVNIPIVGFGVGLSAMYSLRYLQNKQPDVLDKLYEYIYLPLNLKWRLGPKVFRIVIAAGPYALIPANTKIKKEMNFNGLMDASLFGMNVQLGFEFLKHYRISVGYRSDVFQNDLEDLIHNAHGFYLDLLYIL